MLQLKNIVKNYPTATTTVHALRGVSLDFRENEFVAILGPSGCGKTTMLNIIGGLDRYTSGDLVIGGISTATFDDLHWDAYRNATIGFVFQSYNLIPHLTVIENVELALSLIGQKKKERRAKAIAALQRVGMGDEINKRPNQLSGGQMQRVAIARAIVNDPKIILADEPTGALDSELSVQVMDILAELSKTRLVIMVTHNAELAYEYCTRICRFKDGQLISDSDPFNSEFTPYKVPDPDESSPDDVYSAIGKSEVTTDTLSLQNHDLTDDLATNHIAGEDVATPHPEETSAAEASQPGVDLDELYAEPEKEKHVKRVSNRKRKKVMKNIGANTNEAFNRLGLNSGIKKKKTPENKKNKAFKPTSMSAGLAFGLSLRNLISKKGRTAFTAFAGSIGIIGLGLVLSISNGFDLYVDRMQTEMMAGMPMGMYEYNVDVSMMDKMMGMLTQLSASEDDFPEGNGIVITDSSDAGPMQAFNKLLDSFLGECYENHFSQEFVEYMQDEKAHEKIDYNAMSVYYGLRYNLIGTKINKDTGTAEYVDVSTQQSETNLINILMGIMGQSGVQDSNWQVLVGDETHMKSGFDVLAGHYPQNKNEIVLSIGKNNSVSKDLLEAFDIDMYKIDSDGNYIMQDGQPVPIPDGELTFDDFIGRKFKWVPNDLYYAPEYLTEEPVGYDGCVTYDKNSDIFKNDKIVNADELAKLYNSDQSLELKIVGIIRPAKDSSADFVTPGICYTPELQDYVLENSYNSAVAKMQRKLDENIQAQTTDTTIKRMTVFDGEKTDYILQSMNGIELLNLRKDYSDAVRGIGAYKKPAYIKIYPNDYNQKVAIQKAINNWNKDKDEDNYVGFLDISAMITKTLHEIIDLVSYLLIAVAAISLVVSTAMIGVITSNSVVERTREIGILRSLGARKRDIRSIFITETTLIGLASGIAGIVVTYIFCPLISLIIEAVTGGIGVGIANLLQFNPLHALVLVVLSTALTIISGVIPAIMASRKNVVDALRVE